MKLSSGESDRTCSLKEAGSAILAYVKANPINLLTALALAFWAQIVLFGVGTMEWAALQTGNDSVSAFSCGLVMAFVFLRLTHSRRARWVLVALAVLLGCLTPLCTMTQASLVSPQNFDTLLGTDAKESLGLFATIPASEWCLWLTVSLMLVDGVCFSRTFAPAELNPDEVRFFRRWKILAIVCLFIIPAASPINDIGRGICRMAKLRHASPAPSWHVTGCCVKHPEADNYVIVMSESLSKKVLGLYGAPFDTTPFLSSVPTRRIETFVAASHATAAAVSLFAAMEDPQNVLTPQYENNIVQIAREAGLATYWVSSQGRTSAFEASVSFIASQADKQYFVKKHDDFALIPAVKEIVATPEHHHKRRLIFVHTYGAHERTCDRVKDFGRPFRSGGEEVIDCYLAAAAKADEIVRQVAKAIEDAGETYSLIFTSDHAINWRRDNGTLRFIRNAAWQGQFEVPFVQLGAGVTQTAVVNVERASSRFLDYFPAWIGVTTNKTPSGYDIFENCFDEAMVIRPDGEKARFSSLKPTASLSEILLK